MAWLTLEEAGSRLGMSVRQIRTRIKNGEISAVKKAQERGAPRWMIDEAQLSTPSDTPPSSDTTPADPANIEALDAIKLNALSKATDIKLKQQRLATHRDQIIDEIWDDVLSTVEHLLSPLKQALHKCDLTDPQKQLVNAAIDQVSQQLNTLSRD